MQKLISENTCKTVRTIHSKIILNVKLLVHVFSRLELQENRLFYVNNFKESGVEGHEIWPQSFHLGGGLLLQIFHQNSCSRKIMLSNLKSHRFVPCFPQHLGNIFRSSIRRFQKVHQLDFSVLSRQDLRGHFKLYENHQRRKM